MNVSPGRVQAEADRHRKHNIEKPSQKLVSAHKFGITVVQRNVCLRSERVLNSHN